MFLAHGVETFAQHASQNSYHEAKISLTFDDGLTSQYENALPILADRNIPATSFIITNLVGSSGYMNWSQVKSLQDTYGWEVGSHSKTHPELPLLSNSQIRKEIAQSATQLANHGIQATSFATPYGAYDNRVLVEASKYYNVHRGFWDRDDLNTWPFNKTVLMVQSVESSTTLAQVYSWIDQAIAQNKWLILVFHEIQPELLPDYEYTTTIDDFEAIADYIVGSGIQVEKLNHTLIDPGVNLLPSGNFVGGLGAWTSDNANRITFNTRNNGRYPSPANSIRFNAVANKSIHLFSPNVSVTYGNEYLLQAYVNADKMTAGEFGFYIDEYDQAGNWISGQWVGLVAPGQVKDFSAHYTPSNADVSTASVQLYLYQGSAGTVFLDEVALFTVGY
ncbi:polysaccharide deacetylase family protein [candidate division WWE3 bacterium]|uniref:Polysaccharide deacetylase family protein n=1 Tax=candidate division WWE3 bacterium TaxID=2053526 RepID=A0A955LHI1_UNCKA|nr:polysaccharide deacetylase family protein [candidate division WWE3 bacterium]